MSLSDFATLCLVVIAILVLALAAMVICLLAAIDRLQSNLRRLERYLRPEVPRDGEGRRLRERL